MTSEATNRLEGAAATAASVTTLGVAIADVTSVLQLMIGVATLAWWIRLWIRDPSVKPPTLPK